MANFTQDYDPQEEVRKKLKAQLGQQQGLEMDQSQGLEMAPTAPLGGVEPDQPPLSSPLTAAPLDAAPAAPRTFADTPGFVTSKLNDPAHRSTKYDFMRMVQEASGGKTAEQWRGGLDPLVAAYNERYGQNAQVAGEDLIDFGGAGGAGVKDVINGNDGDWHYIDPGQGSPTGTPAGAQTLTGAQSTQPREIEPPVQPLASTAPWEAYVPAPAAQSPAAPAGAQTLTGAQSTQPREIEPPIQTAAPTAPYGGVEQPFTGGPQSAAPAAQSPAAPAQTPQFLAEIRKMLMDRIAAAQQPVDQNDPSIAIPLSAARDEATRASEGERKALAERSYADGTLGTTPGLIDQQIQQSAERNAIGLGGVRSTLIANQMEAKRADLQQTLNMALASGDSEAVRLAQSELQTLNAQLQRESFDVSRRGQDLSADVSREGYGVSRRGQDIDADVSREGFGVSRRGQDIGAATTREGYDVSRRGQDIGAASTRYGQDLNAAVSREGISADMARYMAYLNQLAVQQGMGNGA